MVLFVIVGWYLIIVTRQSNSIHGMSYIDPVIIVSLFTVPFECPYELYIFVLGTFFILGICGLTLSHIENMI